jgi:hypothetical protein
LDDDLTNAAITVLLEDFKARWQELLNTGAEISNWSTAYYSALILTIGWILGRKSKEGLRELFTTERPVETFLVLTLALINAAYVLGIAVRSYHIQQIALYLYEVVDTRIAAITGQPFNSWEDWRRTAFQSSSRIGKPETVRTIYYTLLLILPVGVSATILAMYGTWVNTWQLKGKIRLWLRRRFTGSDKRRAAAQPSEIRQTVRAERLLNIYFVTVLLINILAIALTIYLAISTNNMWTTKIRDRQTSSFTPPAR